MSALNLTALTTTLGDYCREHRDVLVSEALLSDPVSSQFEVMDEVTDEVPLPSLAISDLIRPAKPETFDAAGDELAFAARVLKVRGVKFDLRIIPQQLEKTWLGKLKNPRDPFDLPFEAFIMQKIGEQVAANLNLQAIYGGTYNASGTTPVATMDGFLKLIADAITATDIAPVTTGVITSTNIVDKSEEVYDALGEAYKGMPTEMKVNPQLFDWYNRRYRSLHGSNNNYDGMKQGRLMLDGTNCEIVRTPGLGTSQRMICTPKNNMVFGCDSADTFNLEIEKENRSIKLLGDFKAGVQFKEIHSRALAVNDQA